MSESMIKSIIEAAIFAAEEPLSIGKMAELFESGNEPEKNEIIAALEELVQDYQERGVELVEVASGYRFQVRTRYAAWLARLMSQRPPRYSRALFETLALVAYKQPITRGEIEDVRGVAVSTNIVKILLDREWVKVVGYKDVPGKPALLATTKSFLDYFNLKALTDLPPLSELMDLEELGKKLGIQLNNGEQRKQDSDESVTDDSPDASTQPLLTDDEVSEQSSPLTNQTDQQVSEAVLEDSLEVMDEQSQPETADIIPIKPLADEDKKEDSPEDEVVLNTEEVV